MRVEFIGGPSDGDYQVEPGELRIGEIVKHGRIEYVVYRIIAAPGGVFVAHARPA